MSKCGICCSQYTLQCVAKLMECGHSYCSSCCNEFKCCPLDCSHQFTSKNDDFPQNFQLNKKLFENEGELICGICCKDFCHDHFPMAYTCGHTFYCEPCLHKSPTSKCPLCSSTEGRFCKNYALLFTVVCEKLQNLSTTNFDPSPAIQIYTNFKQIKLDELQLYISSLASIEESLPQLLKSFFHKRRLFAEYSGLVVKLTQHINKLDTKLQTNQSHFLMLGKESVEQEISHVTVDCALARTRRDKMLCGEDSVALTPDGCSSNSNTLNRIFIAQQNDTNNPFASCIGRSPAFPSPAIQVSPSSRTTQSSPFNDHNHTNSMRNNAFESCFYPVSSKMTPDSNISHFFGSFVPETPQPQLLRTPTSPSIVQHVDDRERLFDQDPPIQSLFQELPELVQRELTLLKHSKVNLEGELQGVNKSELSKLKATILIQAKRLFLLQAQRALLCENLVTFVQQEEDSSKTADLSVNNSSVLPNDETDALRGVRVLVNMLSLASM